MGTDDQSESGVLLMNDDMLAEGYGSSIFRRKTAVVQNTSFANFTLYISTYTCGNFALPFTNVLVYGFSTFTCTIQSDFDFSHSDAD